VLKQEMAPMPFVGWYARQHGHGCSSSAATARSSPQRLRDAVALVRAARPVRVPRRHAQPRWQRRTFKGGVAGGDRRGVPVLPVAIERSGAVLPTRVPGAPGHDPCALGTPIATTGLQVEDRNALARRARDAVIDLLHPPQATPDTPDLRRRPHGPDCREPALTPGCDNARMSSTTRIAQAAPTGAGG
jgi:1-acyl-sn-glycerol-3-phosphate acyltransferase